jgi:Pyruvate/2-oxoacid:ferredoxin oxidoreductase gamma subunit
MPIANRFYESNSKYSRQTQEFYERFEDMKQAVATMNAMASSPVEAGDVEEWLEKPENIAGVALKQAFARQAATLAELSNYQDMIRRGAFPEMTSREMTEEIDRIQAEKVQIQRAMNQAALAIERAQ